MGIFQDGLLRQINNVDYLLNDVFMSVDFQSEKKTIKKFESDEFVASQILTDSSFQKQMRIPKR